MDDTPHMGKNDRGCLQVAIRVARWFIFKSNIPIGVNFWRALDWKMLLHFMYGHLKYFTDICDIL
jgi:hypothetical protein